ncbi:multidrug resistance protein [Marinithermofilum abyssi]|uniref:Multidrug resistance protein n=1 Tax=Marinithermofilum abyssi TaxID=1571185 RepID=A0A8J2VJ84_9BACL|nr:MFS transporter [Marinithermofilum abyssi]GGE23722.1 multidrug resistance protein [Marinithermofilum abyssi]
MQPQIDEKQACRSVLTTCLAALFGFMGIGVVDPILPEIAKQIGATHWQVEMLFTTYIFMMAFVMIPSGILDTRFGSKPVMVTGLSLVTLFALACSLSDTVGQLALLRAGWGFGNAMFFATSMSILIGLSSNLEQGMGYYEASLGMGLSMGPLLGGLLGHFSWRLPFVGTGILVLLAAILTAMLVKEPPVRQRKRAGLKDFAKTLRERPFFLSAFSAMLYYYAFFTVLAYSPLLLKLDAIQLGLIFFGWGACLGIGSTKVAHRLVKRHSSLWLTQRGMLWMAVVLILIAIIPISAVQTAVIILSGFVCGLNNTAFSSLTIDVSKAQRSIVSGAYNFIRWLGAGIAPVAAGFSSTIFPTAPYLIATVLIAVGAAILYGNQPSIQRMLDHQQKDAAAS